PLRLLARACGFRSYGTQGSRTRPGLHAFARWRGLTDFDRMVPRARGLALGYTLSPAGAGLRISIVWYPGLADSPWATRFRPLARAYGFRSYGTQGSRTRPGLHAFARLGGVCGFGSVVPRG